MTFDDAAKTRKPSRTSGKTFGLLLSTICLGALLSGCGDSSSSTTGTTRIRTLNAFVPAAGAIGAQTIITTNGVALSGSGALGFGQFSNSGTYTSLTSGNITINTSGATGTPAVSLTAFFNGNNASYTLVLAGEGGQTNALIQQLIPIPNYVANQTVIPSGDVALRVVNVSLNANPVGLYSTASNVPTTAISSTLGSVSYGYSAANAYVAVPTSLLTNLALVDTTNTQTALSLSTASTLNTTTFTSGQAYTLYVYGQPGNAAEPLTATWEQDYP